MTDKAGGGGGPAADPPAKTAGEPTHFAFEHKVFSVPSSYFALAADTSQPTFFVPLGDMQGVLSLPQVMSGFDIKPESSDAALLDKVAKGLAFVKRIHPGDSIPRELLDGTASWKVEDEHRMIAESRVRVQLASWLAGREADVQDLSELLRVANDPAIRDRVQEAVAALAERLGLGRDRKAEVLDRVNKLVRELSYIEALRDRYASIKAIGMKLVQFNQAYGTERGFAQDIGRVITLIKRPLVEYDTLFRQIDSRTSGILEVFRSYDAQVQGIRDARDDLHRRFMIWDDLVPQWQDIRVEVGTAAEALIRATYRLVARHFPQGTDWQLQFGGKKPEAKPYSLSKPEGAR